MYPLQLTTPHSRFRIHSQLYNVPQLRKLCETEVWINPADAHVRHVKNGDLVKIFNDRGAVVAHANVTAEIMQGVVRCYEGAWFDPDEEGIDRGGCVNVLINDELSSPGGASNFNTCLVEVEKLEGS